MTSKDNKFIYFYKGSPENFNMEEFKRVTEHAEKMKNGMDIIPYKIDMEKNKDALMEFLKERNPKMVDSLEDQIKNNNFLLANKYDDIWFWELQLIEFFYGDLLE